MSYEAAVKEMKAGDVYEKSAMDSLDALIGANLFRPEAMAITYAILSLRATIKADSEMRMDNR